MMRANSIICYGAKYLNVFNFSDSFHHMDMFKQIHRKEMCLYKYLFPNSNTGAADTTYFKRQCENRAFLISDL
jgi:hypothetical protein